jgi:glyoxylase-like metal-dependent hydrolase (beta-lactamase superfamily II)
MREILPGVWHWSAEHPGIHQAVSSYYLAESGTALDPIDPGQLGDRPVRQVVLTNRLHSRDAAELAVPIRAPAAGLGNFDDKPFGVEPYAPGDELAPGVRALELAAIAPDDGVLYLEGKALHFADGLLVRGGELALMPDELMDDPTAVKARTFERLDELLELDFDALLFAHSDPIPTGGRAQLEAFVRR